MPRTSSHMKRALTLAGSALGTTSPNPAVGAVVVKDEVVVGEGFTLPPGQAHAEIVALGRAGELAKRAALYVTLEPCCSYGRTPPCTKAIVAAGISEVHVGTTDPNPKVNGKGVSELKAAGVAVHIGEGEKQAKGLIEAFGKYVTTGVPYVTAKFAMSLDGKIATYTGDSKWVTGPPARSYVREMRRTSDAIMVGINTVLRDNPRLTARDEMGRPLDRQPLRVILDSRARTPPDSLLLKEPGHTIIATTEPPGDSLAALTDLGAEVLRLPAAGDGMVDPWSLLQVLGARDVVSVLVEGGSALLGSLFDLGLVDKVAAFIAPVVIGGHDAPSPVGGVGRTTMSQVLRLERVTLEKVGDDILVVGYPPLGGRPESAIVSGVAEIACSQE